MCVYNAHVPGNQDTQVLVSDCVWTYIQKDEHHSAEIDSFFVNIINA